MNNHEMQLALRTLAEVQGAITRDPALIRAAAEAQRHAAAVRTALASVAEQLAVARSSVQMGLDNMRGTLRILAEVVVAVRDALPPNWPRKISYRRAIELAVDGIPVAWVPSADLLTKLMAAETRSERMKILHANRDAINDDLLRVLDEVTHPSLTGQVPLARAAVAAWSEGHVAPAQSLAVVVTEAVVSRHFAQEKEGYSKLRERVKIDLDDPEDDVPLSETRLMIAVAPIWSFYMPWWPNSGDPVPESLSRHVTVHQADTAHYTPDNALVAVMLQTSVLRAFQEVLELQEAKASSGP